MKKPLIMAALAAAVVVVAAFGGYNHEFVILLILIYGGVVCWKRKWVGGFLLLGVFALPLLIICLLDEYGRNAIKILHLIIVWAAVVLIGAGCWKTKRYWEFLPLSLFVLPLLLISMVWLDCYCNELSERDEEKIGYFTPQESDYIFHGDAAKNHRNKEYFITEESDYKDTVDFELYANYGDFWYSVWINAIDTGTVYLKAYRIGKIRDIHSLGLEKETGMEIYNHGNGFVKCGPRYFSMYAGLLEADCLYLARFELWYKPKNSDEERKLTSKIYKVRRAGM
jgi:hypothetical protein